jgi:methyltransferase (TIGR00027 family)
MVDREWPGDLGTVAARTRFIDDYLKSRVRKGVRQIVILGAGLDSRAYRIEGLKGAVTVFEVDHPATQRVKKEKVKKTLGSLPDHVVYVSMDFMKEKLEEKLPEHGYDRNSRTLFIWEGVTMYITAEAVDETLAFVAANSGEGSSVVFDYLQYSSGYEPLQRNLLRKGQEHVRKRGEAWIFGIQEGSVDEFLTKRGFHQVVNATAKDLKEAYFKGRNQSRILYAFLPVVHATVKPRA